MQQIRRHKIEDKGLKQPMVNNILWYVIHISIQRKTEPNQHKLMWAQYTLLLYLITWE